MRSLSASELLTVWESGWSAPPFERALALLSAAMPEASLAALAQTSLGCRDLRLLRLREWVFGPNLALLISCPQCSQVMEVSLPAKRLRAVPDEGLENPTAVENEVVAGDYRVRCRPLTSEDLAACASLEASASRTQLFQRCVLESLHQERALTAAELPDNVVQKVIEHVAASDPQADMRVNFSCPDCRRDWTETFDIVSFFWIEIDAWARRILREVHTLATAYGWREGDILALSPGRRQMYLTMVQA
jgi:hypothetical protein